MINKLQGLLNSRRFWVAIGGVAFVIFDGRSRNFSRPSKPPRSSWWSLDRW